jgi:hypothetical protein
MQKQNKKPSSPLTAAELGEKIEKWAPRKYCAERARLYADLCADGIASEVLLAIQHVHGFHTEEQLRLQGQKDYWRKRKAIEKRIEDIRRHPLVTSVGEIVFRQATPACPHGRERLECEEIRHNLLAYKRRPPYLGAPKNDVGERIGHVGAMVREAAEREERARKFLADYKFDKPDLLNPADFCESPDLSEPWDHEAPAALPGRPPTLRMQVLKAVMLVLKQCRLSQHRKLEYVERVLRYCFDEKADATELAARWREIKRNPQPDASDWFPFEQLSLIYQGRRKPPC